MKLYKTWICKKDGVYTVSKTRPKCALCGNLMYRAPGEFSHLVFPVVSQSNSENVEKQDKKIIEPVTLSETLGAPRGIVMAKEFREKNQDDKAKKGRKKKEMES